MPPCCANQGGRREGGVVDTHPLIIVLCLEDALYQLSCHPLYCLRCVDLLNKLKEYVCNLPVLTFHRHRRIKQDRQGPRCLILHHIIIDLCDYRLESLVTVREIDGECAGCTEQDIAAL